MKTDYSLYASALPLFALLLTPRCYWYLLPVNFLVTALAIYISLRFLSCGALFKRMWKKELYLAWLAGFAGDVAGAGALFGLTALQDKQGALGLAITGVRQNPFSSTTSLLLVFLAILLAAAVKYLLDLWVAFRKTDLPLHDKRTLCLSVAMFTAPYTFLLPAAWLGFLS